MDRELPHHPPDDNLAERIATLWRQAEGAAAADQPARAQRFLRWIVSVAPDDEEAWLWLARLASNQEKLVYLCKAYSLFPSSNRVRFALRQARAEQLEAAVGHLRRKAAGLACLPDERQLRTGNHDERQNRRSADAVSTNGRRAAT